MHVEILKKTVQKKYGNLVSNITNIFNIKSSQKVRAPPSVETSHFKFPLYVLTFTITPKKLQSYNYFMDIGDISIWIH